MKKRLSTWTGFLLAFACAATAQAAGPTPDVNLPSTPKTVIRGVISAERAPVLTIKSGQTVKIDTVSHGGMTDDPAAFFAQAGIPADQVLKDVIDIAKMPRQEGFGGHVLTGPIYVYGAEPGDMLEVRIHKLEHRVPYGVNNPGTGGVAPGLLSERVDKIIKLDLAKGVALFSPEINVPLRPFLGIMAVAPPAEVKQVGSRAPGLFGGNMDFKDLREGATLYLPVLSKGALFYAGDAHAGQGDGEVSGNAIEASLTATLEFVVHKDKGKAMTAPFAEDADHVYVMGLDPDLNVAMKNAVLETVKFLGAEKGLSKADAYSLASIGVDYAIAEAVDGTLLIYGAIGKGMFKAKTPYWAEK